MQKKNDVNSIGYFIPEFPGQTHNFFWREYQALIDLGIKPHFISTRRPPQGVTSPSWARQAESETIYLYPATIKESIRILLVLLSAGPISWLNCLKIIFRALDLSITQRFSLIVFIPMAAKLILVSRFQNWNHIHVHSCGNAANIALFAKQFSSVTYSLTLHNSLSASGGNQEQKWFNASFALVVSKALYNEVTNQLEFIRSQKLEIAPMGVNVDKFTRNAPYKPYIGSGEINLFSCARLNPGKGFEVLILAVSILIKQGVDVRLIIAGEDDKGGSGYRVKLEQQISDLGLNSTVTLLGAVPEEQVMAQLGRAHLFVLASYSEGVPVVLMESMAMNVPSICTHVGGVPELITNGVDGVLVPPGNAEILAESILNLAKNQEQANRISVASRKKIVQSFGYQRSAQAIKDALSDLNLL